jgi:hypothetical protein
MNNWFEILKFSSGKNNSYVYILSIIYVWQKYMSWVGVLGFLSFDVI